jgi:hypothetical protein
MPVLIFPKRLDFEQVSVDSEMPIFGQAPRNNTHPRFTQFTLIPVE